MSQRVPARRFYGDAMSNMMHSLYLDHQREVETPSRGTLLGYRVPDFQRKDDCWSLAQQVRFIESIYLGASIGTYMVNIPSSSASEELNNVLLDGLQRLTALKAYFSGEIAVNGQDGLPHLWTELLPTEQAHLLRVTFPWVMTRYSSRDQMIAAYERHNFGGTPHTDADKSRFQNLFAPGAGASAPVKRAKPTRGDDPGP